MIVNASEEHPAWLCNEGASVRQPGEPSLKSQSFSFTIEKLGVADITQPSHQ